MLLQIATDIAPKTCEELREEFYQVNLRSHALAGECIERYGGFHAKKRWAKCGVASLRFTQRLDVTCFVPTSDRSRNEIDIQVGAAPYALKSYLTLEYQIFHEYLSHLFPIWDSAAGMFSEGDMAALERWVYPRLAPSGLHVLVLNAREREVIIASDNQGRDWANHQEEMADEVRLRWISEENLTRLLLEIASAPEQDLPFDVRDSLLHLLHYLPKVAHNRSKKRQIEVVEVLRDVGTPLDLEESLRKYCFPQNMLG